MLILMTCFFIQHNNEQTVFSHMEIDPKTLTISVCDLKYLKKSISNLSQLFLTAYIIKQNLEVFLKTTI